MKHPVNFRGLELTHWTPVARLSPLLAGRHRWEPLDDAPLSLAEAKAGHAVGLLLMAQRREEGRTFLVFKTPRSGLRRSLRTP